MRQTTTFMIWAATALFTVALVAILYAAWSGLLAVPLGHRQQPPQGAAAAATIPLPKQMEPPRAIDANSPAAVVSIPVPAVPVRDVVETLRKMQADPRATSLGPMLHSFASNFSPWNDPARKEQVFYCLRAWNPPPSISRFDADLIVGLEAVDGGLAVREEELANANIHDSDLEQCLTDVWRNTVIPVDGAVPGNLYKITWPLSLAHRP